MSENTVLEVKVVGWYALCLVLFTIGIQIFFALSEPYLGIPGSTGTPSTLIAVLVTMVGGDFYYKRTRSLPTKVVAWRMAAWFLAVNIVLGAASLLLVSQLKSYEGFTLDAFSDPGLLTFLVISSVIFVVASRFLFPYGASIAKQRLDKKTT